MTHEKEPLTLLDRVQEDYTANFMMKKEIRIFLNPEEIQELLVSEELDKMLLNAWAFKIYLRQLLLASTLLIEPMKLKDLLWNIKTEEKASFNKKGVRALLAALNLRYFMSSQSDYALKGFFTGESLWDDHCAQLAYEEYQKRLQNHQWQKSCSTGEEVENDATKAL